MIIKSVIHERYPETEIHVCKNAADEEVRRVMNELHALYDQVVTGTDAAGDKHRLRPNEIVSFYAEKQKVFALTAKEKYTVSETLTELETSFGSSGFFRISKSELVNLRQIRSLDMSLTGTIRVIMKTGYETYTSRRNVTRLKDVLRKESL